MKSPQKVVSLLASKNVSVLLDRKLFLCIIKKSEELRKIRQRLSSHLCFSIKEGEDMPFFSRFYGVEARDEITQEFTDSSGNVDDYDGR